MNNRNSNGFSFPEILIVIFVIGVLAVLGFGLTRESQMRSKTAIARSQMKSIAMGIEGYYADAGEYPPGIVEFTQAQFHLILASTPIAYVKEAYIDDVFPPRNPGGLSFDETLANSYQVRWQPDSTSLDHFGTFRTGWYYLHSSGPDRERESPFIDFRSEFLPSPLTYIYDPSNGTVSSGDIFVSGGKPAPTDRGRHFQQLTRR